MKHILLLCLLALSGSAFGQITNDSVVGTWTHFDEKGVEQKLVITKDSVTVMHESQSTEDSNEWLTISYTGPYTIEKGNRIHVIFNDQPREEAYYKVVRDEDGTLQILVQSADKKGKVELVYKRR